MTVCVTISPLTSVLTKAVPLNVSEIGILISLPKKMNRLVCNNIFPLASVIVTLATTLVTFFKVATTKNVPVEVGLGKIFTFSVSFANGVDKTMIG